MTFTLSGAHALVTGASRGLGRHIARALAARGAVVHLVARSEAELEAVKAELGNAEVHALDISDRAATEALLRDLPIDVLVNNAGIETVAYFHELRVEQITRILDVNLVSALVLARLVLPSMLARKRGHIVNISSLAGKTGPPLAEAYATTKAGLIGFSQSLRASYAGTGVSASVVCPGFVSGEGMFADRARHSNGEAPPSFVGTSTPEQVAAAVMRAIQTDAPELLVTPTPARLLGALAQLQPRLPGWLLRRMRLREFYERQRHT